MRVNDLLISMQEEKAALLLKSAPFRKKREDLLKKLQPMEAELRQVNEQIKSIEGATLFDLDQQIGALTRSLKTTTSFSAESAAAPQAKKDNA